MTEEQKPILAFKAFNSDMTCRGFQYEVGKTYDHEGSISICRSGFHACPAPFSVWGYYPRSPETRYALVEQSGEVEADGDKTVSSRIAIKASLDLAGMFKAQVEWVRNTIKTATTGNKAHSATTGYEAHSATTGYEAHSATTGDNSIAASLGRSGRAKAALNSWIVLSEYDDDGNLLSVQTAEVNNQEIKADTYYRLVDGNFSEVE